MPCRPLLVMRREHRTTRIADYSGDTSSINLRFDSIPTSGTSTRVEARRERCDVASRWGGRIGRSERVDTRGTSEIVVRMLPSPRRVGFNRGIRYYSGRVGRAGTTAGPPRQVCRNHRSNDTVCTSISSTEQRPTSGSERAATAAAR